jgi:hypothetical protein
MRAARAFRQARGICLLSHLPFFAISVRQFLNN